MPKTIKQPMSSQEMIDMIRGEVYSGHGFVPFVGSGMSAPSGILMGMEFQNYLAYSVWRVVKGLTKDSTEHETKSTDESRFWDLRRHGWPRYPTDEEVEEVKKWTYEQFEKMCDRRGYKVTRDHESGDDYKVKKVDFDDDKASPTAVVRAINRPLIPEIIRSDKEETWRLENQARELQRHFRGPGKWADFDEGDAFSRTSRSYTLEHAIRSLHDWRATLQFLSRVRYEPDTQRISIESTQESSVIDSFNTYITREGQINLGQKMLAHLAGPMRVRTILTTNFDRLIEKAYRRLFIPLQVVPVSTRGELPNSQTVRARNTLVKLHGDSIETRADFTLDHEPSETDKESFARYVRGEFDESEKTFAIPNHMIVMGFSGADMRIIQMMKYLLDTHSDVTIFWIGYQANSHKKIQRKFGDEYKGRLMYHNTARPDLFLYELYQELALCLPEGGFSYEFTHKVPPERLGETDPNCEAELLVMDDGDRVTIPKFDTSTAAVENKKLLFKKVRKAISIRVGEQLSRLVKDGYKKKLHDWKYPDNNPLAIITANSTISKSGKPEPEKSAPCDIRLYIGSGGASAMRVAFQSLSNSGIYCIWFELQDYTDVQSLTQDILRTIALRVGMFQSEHFVLAVKDITNENPSGDHLARLLKFLGVSRKKWTVFLYGRNIPGACAGWSNAPWSSRHTEKLERLIAALNTAGIHTIYVPLTKGRVDRDRDKIGIDKINKKEMEQRLITRFHLKDEEPVGSPGNRQNQEKRLLEWKYIETNLTSTRKESIGTKDSDGAIMNPLVPIDPKKPLPDPDSPYSVFATILDEVLTRWIEPADNATPDEAHEYLRRLKFLYATTLFRQSRHTAAFFAESVYSCPFRFNTIGSDNDWIRATQVRRWIKELGELNVFFYKPGGYNWKYRDIRLGIQTSLEVVPFFRFWRSILERFGIDYTVEESQLQFPTLDFFLQMRARAHFWIGDWYFKAFTATGHFLPVIESLYHRFETIRFAPVAKPSRLKYVTDREAIFKYRFILIRSAILEMIKTIQIAKPGLKFWLSSHGSTKVFGVDGVKELHTGFEDVFSQLTKYYGKRKKIGGASVDDWIGKLRALSTILEKETECLNNSISNESTERDAKKWRPPALPEAVDEPYFDTAYRKPFTLPSYSLSFDEIAAEKDFAKKDFKKHLGDLDAPEIYEVIANYSSKTTEDLKNWKTDWIFENAKDIVGSTGKSQDSCRLLFLVELIADFAFCVARRAKIEFKAEGLSTLEIRKRWVQCSILCNLGLDLCKHFHPVFLSAEIQTKTKLQSIYGLSLSYLGRPFEANRHFNEAEALLSKASSSTKEIEHAKVRIRRAEAFLVQTEQISNVLDALPDDQKFDADDSAFGNNDTPDRVLENVEATMHKKAGRNGIKIRFCDSPTKPLGSDEVHVAPLIKQAVEKAIDNYERVSTDKRSLKNCCKDVRVRLSRLHSATLDDAWVSLESAQQLLAGRSHSSLWWGKIAALRLHAYGQIREDASFESLVFRRKVQHDEEVRRLKDRMLLIAPDCVFTKIETVELVSKAIEALNGQNAAVPVRFTDDDFDELNKHIEDIYGCDHKPELIKQYPNLIKQYINRVIASYEKLETPKKKEDEVKKPRRKK